MIDFDHVLGFEWDEGNAQKSERKHGITRAEAEQLFSNAPFLVVDDVLHSETETRLHALGRTDAGRYLHVTFTLRGNSTLIRVISARLMNRKERNRYEEEA